MEAIRKVRLKHFGLTRGIKKAVLRVTSRTFSPSCRGGGRPDQGPMKKRAGVTSLKGGRSPLPCAPGGLQLNKGGSRSEEEEEVRNSPRDHQTDRQQSLRSTGGISLGTYSAADDDLPRK